ncbi:hypothetical protein ACHAXT_006253 [Thalassiosira profunda]
MAALDDDGPSAPNADASGDNGASSSDAPISEQQQLPIELQLYQVDLANPDMDPLEYAFRSWVPIPRAYFWDTACEANSYHQNLPLRTKLWHRSIYWGGEVLKRAEAVGGAVAGLLGLNDGPFDYVTDNMTEDEMRASQANVERRREEQAEIERRKEGDV